MRNLKKDLLDEIYTRHQVNITDLVEDSAVLQFYQRRSDLTEEIEALCADAKLRLEIIEKSDKTNRTALLELLCCFLNLESKWSDYAGPVAVFHDLCEKARLLGARPENYGASICKLTSGLISTARGCETVGISESSPAICSECGGTGQQRIYPGSQMCTGCNGSGKVLAGSSSQE